MVSLTVLIYTMLDHETCHATPFGRWCVVRMDWTCSHAECRYPLESRYVFYELYNTNQSICTTRERSWYVLLTDPVASISEPTRSNLRTQRGSASALNDQCSDAHLAQSSNSSHPNLILVADQLCNCYILAMDLGLALLVAVSR
ncbi:hypothetical protein SISSUDRAFT_860138 [Sistotremastrum suecicum HHB10207 ss-3]|uniref:Uncharacterized protein n=1 Tax=Sistotremastrum suecicum HHB10207 ss-3 TaxID=1314776 RepID=A0A166CF47_9AGAM|nr:hypothetical protein SISSUDRAFT_860138 [Sistotremastrum suecicum HHB10207 ss-3]